MATAGRKKSMVQDAAEGTAKTRATRKKAEGIAAAPTKGMVVSRTGIKGGKKNPTAAETGGGKLKGATAGQESVGAETGGVSGAAGRSIG